MVQDGSSAGRRLLGVAEAAVDRNGDPPDTPAMFGHPGNPAGSEGGDAFEGNDEQR
jgi:hypothetical protein